MKALALVGLSPKNHVCACKNASQFPVAFPKACCTATTWKRGVRWRRSKSPCNSFICSLSPDGLKRLQLVWWLSSGRPNTCWDDTAAEGFRLVFGDCLQGRHFCMADLPVSCVRRHSRAGLSWLIADDATFTCLLQMQRGLKQGWRQQCDCSRPWMR